MMKTRWKRIDMKDGRQQQREKDFCRRKDKTRNRHTSEVKGDKT